MSFDCQVSISHTCSFVCFQGTIIFCIHRFFQERSGAQIEQWPQLCCYICLSSMRVFGGESAGFWRGICGYLAGNEQGFGGELAGFGGESAGIWRGICGVLAGNEQVFGRE